VRQAAEVNIPRPATTQGPAPQAAPPSLLHQPKAVWAVAFACVVSFMGLGLVDPILPALSSQLHATPAQVELLFTSYLLVTGVAMLITGAVSSRLGPKWTLLGGLALIIIFSAAAGASGTINGIIGFRAGWGLGNALFIATALAVIVGVASGGAARAIILYEAALGLGISVGPLLGGALGGMNWRYPFYGVAVLMSIAFIATAFLLPALPKPARRSSLLDPIRALRHRGLLTMGVTAFCYNFGFFTILAYAPFPMRLDAHHLGLVYFGWGVLLAITSVFVAPRLSARVGTVRTMYAMLTLIALDLVVMGIGAASASQATLVIVIAVILFGGVPGREQHTGDDRRDGGLAGRAACSLGGLQLRALYWRRDRAMASRKRGRVVWGADPVLRRRRRCRHQYPGAILGPRRPTRCRQRRGARSAEATGGSTSGDRRRHGGVVTAGAGLI